MNKKIILYIIIGVILLGLLLVTFFPNIMYVVRDSSSTGTDKCTPPVGQTEEAWQEHMSHHPEMYKECLT